MSKMNELAKQHSEEQEKIGKCWARILKEAKDKLIHEHMSKREALTKQLDKLKAQEKQLSTDLTKNEKQSLQQLADISSRLSALEVKNRSFANSSTKEKEAEIDKKIEELRNQQLNQIWTETLQDITNIIERHKDRVKRMEQILMNKMNEEKSLLKFSDHSSNPELIALKEQEKTICDQRSKDIEEFIGNLDRVKRDIDKKIKEIADVDQKEKDKLLKLEEVTREKENKERKEAVDKFLVKVKEFCKKSGTKISP
jgi:hypothetical protein